MATMLLGADLASASLQESDVLDNTVTSDRQLVASASASGSGSGSGSGSMSISAGLALILALLDAFLLALPAFALLAGVFGFLMVFYLVMVGIFDAIVMLVF
eukprot:CAMPEP_0113308336 /NCGR_PEP_ID=MMETSP0010_2-20120614/6812_1 /TAXON_ID=216773 ORGANISM="Corethron hystrix, Strain 308" /NCGR_SAMPLE_ID=MMETSP0010_2 /ASSEMBLY_ACC=CAM_ASM_000155 /LENGTH=101 /DNA_ID=CAMNT_0000163351 /DNA_START=158 /DNA_END=460 /DNA_ORIENTATION=- /assembly_acc=CAM_ASM_000155